MKHRSLSKHLGWAAMLIAGLLLSGCSAQKTVQKSEVLAFPPPPEEPKFFYELTLRSNRDVGLADDANKGPSLAQILTGQSPGGDRVVGLSKPYSVAAGTGRVWVGDSVSSRVYGFDLANKKFIEIAEGSFGAVGKPLGIDVTADGTLFVVDATQKRVLKFTRDGEFVSTFGGKDMFDRPSGIAVSADGSKVFVVDTGGVESKNHRLRVFDGDSGEHLYDIGSRGTGPGEFNLPKDADIGPDGRLYVSDSANFRVQVLEQDGTFVKQWGKVGTQWGDFARPKGIAVDAEGNVYVADAAFGNFQIFNSSGELLLFVGSRSRQDGNVRYMLPAGLDVDEDGRVYFVDQFYRKVDVFRPSSVAEKEGRFMKGDPLFMPKEEAQPKADEKK